MSFNALLLHASPSKIRFWGDKQEALWHVMVNFSGVVNLRFPQDSDL